MRVLSKLTPCFLFWEAAVLLLLGNTTIASEFDPYRILGVSRHASLSEIKRAYRQRAKEWHPDKNKDPEADDMFIKISKAHEILSCDKCRLYFDWFGQTDNSDSQGSYDNFAKFWTRASTPAKHLVNYVKYINEVVPNSFKKPYLIKVTSESCSTCLYLEPIWKEIIQELEPQGVGIGVVDFTVEKRLVQYIGVFDAPQILGIINGRVVVFKGNANKESLRRFVDSLLPNVVLQKIFNLFPYLHHHWEEMMLFSSSFILLNMFFEIFRRVTLYILSLIFPVVIQIIKVIFLLIFSLAIQVIKWILRLGIIMYIYSLIKTNHLKILSKRDRK